MVTIEIYKDKRGEWRWRARAQNARALADSGEGYKRRAALPRALDRLFTDALRVDSQC